MFRMVQNVLEIILVQNKFLYGHITGPPPPWEGGGYRYDSIMGISLSQNFV